LDDLGKLAATKGSYHIPCPYSGDMLSCQDFPHQTSLPVGFNWSPSSPSCHQEQLEDCHPAWDGFAQLVCVVSVASVFFT